MESMNNYKYIPDVGSADSELTELMNVLAEYKIPDNLENDLVNYVLNFNTQLLNNTDEVIRESVQDVQYEDMASKITFLHPFYGPRAEYIISS